MEQAIASGIQSAKFGKHGKKGISPGRLDSLTCS